MEQAKYIAHIKDKETMPQSVETHLLGTASIAKKYANTVGLAELGELLGLLHDWGKYSLDFQQYITKSSTLHDQDCDASDLPNQIEYKNQTSLPKIDHSTAGAQFVWKRIGANNKNWLNVLAAEMLGIILAGHHCGLMDMVSDGTDFFIKRMEKGDEKTHLTEIEAKVSQRIFNRVDELLTSKDTLQELERFLLIMKTKEDAVTKESLRDLESSSATSYQKLNQNEIIRAGAARLLFDIGCLTKFLFSVLIDADRCDTIDFCVDGAAKARQNSNYTEWSVLSERLEQYLSKFPENTLVNRLRKNISDSCRDAAERGRGIFTLTVPTGGGKTLASMRFALELAKRSANDIHPIERIIYVLPYTTIIDQNAAKAREILETEHERGKIVLECHSNLLAENETWEGKLLSENWDAPIIFTTNVQFLEAIFSGGTKSIRRMHQLADSIIIFDEIQTLPIKTVHIFCNALNFLVDYCGSTALLCTATQPLLNGVSKDYGALRYGAENEIIPDTKTLFPALKRVDIKDCTKIGGYSIEELSDMAIEKQKEFRSVLIIVNTTSVARKLYESIIFRLGNENKISVIHLSALMCPAHRRLVLDNVNAMLRVDKPIICVSTQVMESGVDVDFGTVIRSISGLDSVVQAAGRCNREGRRKQAYLFIVNPASENVDKLIDIKHGQHSAKRVLNEISSNPAIYRPEILSPDNIAHYFQYYFYERQEEMRYNVETDHGSDTLWNLLSLNTMNAKTAANSRKLRQAFATAGKLFEVIDAPTKGIIVQYGEGEHLIKQISLADEPSVLKSLLHKAQRFSVNIYPYQLEYLYKNGGIYKQQLCGGKTEVCILKQEFYSNDFGLSISPVKKLKLEVI